MKRIPKRTASRKLWACALSYKDTASETLFISYARECFQGSFVKQAVILAGGKGTRLQSRLDGRPKPLVDINGIPLLERQLRLLHRHGFSQVLLLVSHGAQQIREYCEQRTGGGTITILDDGGAPRGTAGAVLQALPYLDRRFLVVYGDTLLNVDLARFWNWHAQDPQTAASLFLHPNDHPQDSDLVQVDDEDRIVAFHPYPHSPGEYLINLSNAALYIVERELLRPWSEQPGLIDFAKNLFPEMLRQGAKLRGYQSFEYIKDAGTPERLDRVSRHLSAGIVDRATLETPQRSVLIDRDGTLNRHKGFIRQAEDLELFESAGPALKRLNESEWRTVLVTNQPVVARGETTFQELRRISAKLETELARFHAYLDRSYICPHHPDRGFAGEVPSLKIACSCRKPAAGLIEQAQRDLNLDLSQCWLVGDSTADLGAAAQARVTSILVQTGEAGLDDKYPFYPDMTVPDFAAAVRFIVEVFPQIAGVCEPFLPLMAAGTDWAISGDSFAEVQALTAVLRHQLQCQGKECISVPICRWQHVSDRNGIVIDVNELKSSARNAAERCKGTVQLDLPYFSQKLRKRLPINLKQEFAPPSIVLWYGTAAENWEEQLPLHQKIYVQGAAPQKLRALPGPLWSAAHVVDLRSVPVLNESIPELIV
jgi:D,D-heptose 1,7-bisphosphate phosphatase